MPEITEQTARVEITIAGETFSVPQPYSAGDVLNANEASALNQTYAENIRNNLASKVKEQKEAGSFEHDVFQGQVDDYVSGYEFGVRTGGGRTGDPVQQEAMAIARDAVRRSLAKRPDVKLSDVPASKITELAKGVLARGDATSEKIMATARARVEASAGITDVQLDSLDSGSEAPAEGKSSKKKAAASAEA